MTAHFDLPTWARNDLDKIAGKPGLVAAHERLTAAVDALDAILAIHAGCKPSLCPTVSAYQRVLADAGYRGEARWGTIRDEKVIEP